MFLISDNFFSLPVILLREEKVGHSRLFVSSPENSCVHAIPINGTKIAVPITLSEPRPEEHAVGTQGRQR